MLQRNDLEKMIDLRNATLEDLETLYQDAKQNVSTRQANLKMALSMGVNPKPYEHKKDIAIAARDRILSWTWKKAKGVI